MSQAIGFVREKAADLVEELTQQLENRQIGGEEKKVEDDKDLSEKRRIQSEQKKAKKNKAKEDKAKIEEIKARREGYEDEETKLNEDDNTLIRATNVSPERF